jgi:hypothetical protein
VINVIILCWLFAFFASGVGFPLYRLESTPSVFFSFCGVGGGFEPWLKSWRLCHVTNELIGYFGIKRRRIFSTIGTYLVTKCTKKVIPG